VCAAIYAPFVRDTPITLEEVPPDSRELARRIEWISASYPWLVADQDGRDGVVGYAYASPHHERAGFRWAVDVAVYVAPVAHRRGIGAALYRELLARLAAQGFAFACAGITLPNAPSVGLHESLGFVRVAVHPRIAYKLGRWWDVGWWQLSLPGGAAEQSPPVEPTPPGPRGAAEQSPPGEPAPPRPRGAG
jgi:phosphinothricin acetyltransferase